MGFEPMQSPQGFIESIMTALPSLKKCGKKSPLTFSLPSSLESLKKWPGAVGIFAVTHFSSFITGTVLRL